MEPGRTRTLILKFVQHAHGTFTLPNDAGEHRAGRVEPVEIHILRIEL